MPPDIVEKTIINIKRILSRKRSLSRSGGGDLCYDYNNENDYDYDNDNDNGAISHKYSA